MLRSVRRMNVAGFLPVVLLWGSLSACGGGGGKNTPSSDAGSEGGEGGGIAGMGGTPGMGGLPGGGGDAGVGGVAGSGGADAGGSPGAGGNSGMGGTGTGGMGGMGTGGMGGMGMGGMGGVGMGGTGGAGMGGTGGAGMGGMGGVGMGGTGGAGTGGMGGMATGGMGAGGMGTGGMTAGCVGQDSACEVNGAAGLCRDGTCLVCTDVTDDAACQASYGTGRLCIDGACVAAECRDSAECGGGQLCKGNACVACTDVDDDGACGAGNLCIGGACVPASCRTNGDCGNGQLCKANQCASCAEPSDDGECTTRYGAGSICDAGTCKVGCRTQAACSAGQICKDKACGMCDAGDTALCAERYGNASVCVAGACSLGTCADSSACGGGTLCTTGMCGACAGPEQDGACQARYGNDHLCIGGACVVANCRSDSTCGNGQLCRSNSCGGCTDVTDDDACGARYGAGNICHQGVCQPGCRTNAECSAGQLCKDNACGACGDPADDAACASRYGAGQICKQGTCSPGCRVDSECGNGQLCKSLTCAACEAPADDGACVSTYGDGNICKSGACQSGCRTASGCVGADTGRLCTNDLCTACTEDAAGDAACKDQYGDGRVCVSGACVPGNCRSSADCVGDVQGQLCVSNQCTPCTTNAGCQADQVYGQSTICHVASGAQQGRCVSDACGPASQTCSANPSVNFCCASGGGGNACVTGNCCSTSDCPFGQICTANQCVLCNLVTDGEYFVDPVNGSDTAGVTGSSTCAWKTITYALAQLAASNQAARVNIKATGDVGAQETFPIGIATTLANGGGNIRIVPANRTLRGAGSDVPTIKVPSGQYAFALAAPNSRITQLTIESAQTQSDAVKANYGIRVFQGSDDTTVIDHVTIRNTRYASIRVERSGSTSSTSGVLTVQGGLVVTGAGGRGAIHVLDTGKATLNAGPGPDAITLSGNSYGISVTARGAVTATGVAAWPLQQGGGLGTFVIKGNTTAGISVGQCISLVSQFTANQAAAPALVLPAGGSCGDVNYSGLDAVPPSNVFDGVAVWDQNQGTANGIAVAAGSSVKVRNSVVLGSARSGVVVSNGPTQSVTNSGGSPANWTYTVYDLSGIDLGTEGSPGQNVLQAGQGSGYTNLGAGLQLGIANAKGQSLSAVGNVLQRNDAPSQTVDCAQTAAVVSRNYPNISTCAAGNPAGGIAVCGNLTGATPNSVNLSMCSLP